MRHNPHSQVNSLVYSSGCKKYLLVGLYDVTKWQSICQIIHETLGLTPRIIKYIIKMYRLRQKFLLLKQSPILSFPPSALSHCSLISIFFISTKTKYFTVPQTHTKTTTGSQNSLTEMIQVTKFAFSPNWW